MGAVFIMLSKLLVASLASATFANLQELDTFNQFKSKFNKQYASKSENQKRFQIFKENLIQISNLNENHRHTTFGINKFSDLTDEEFKSQNLMDLPYPISGDEEFECPEKFKIPEGWSFSERFEANLDWRDPGMNHVNRVADVGPKDQAQCGSCYAFAAVGAMEGSLCRNGLFDCAEWIGLGEQQVLDCGSYDSDVCDEETGECEDRQWYEFNGCYGGKASNVFQYVYKQGGITCGHMYPYISGNETAYPDSGMNIGECYFDPAETEVHGTPDKTICGTLDSYKKGGAADSLEIKAMIHEKGPAAFAMYVNGSFRHYESGVYSNVEEDCPNFDDVGTNHAMTIVGYGFDEDSQKDYWIVKNSWGAHFGQGGYIKIEMGSNVCGIENDVVYVNMVGGEPDEEETTTAPITDAPETDAPETDAPETDAPETDPAPVTTDSALTTSGSNSIFASIIILSVLTL